MLKNPLLVPENCVLSLDSVSEFQKPDMETSLLFHQTWLNQKSSISYMVVSTSRGTPKLSILMGFSHINQPLLGGSPMVSRPMQRLRPGRLSMLHSNCDPAEFGGTRRPGFCQRFNARGPGGFDLGRLGADGAMAAL